MPTIGEVFVFHWVDIDIVYVMPTIGEIFVFCWVSLGPSGPGYGGMWISLSLHGYCLYQANNYRCLYILLGLHIYCIYLANNWRDICILLGFFGPFGPRVWGDVNQFKFTLILYISCQQLERDLYFVGFSYILYIPCQQLEIYL